VTEHQVVSGPTDRGGGKKQANLVREMNGPDSRRQELKTEGDVGKKKEKNQRVRESE